jgi:hypothetical protein
MASRQIALSHHFCGLSVCMMLRLGTKKKEKGKKKIE